MHFDGLRKSERQDQLLVAIRFQVAAALYERRQWMVVRVVQGLALVFHDKRAQVHLAGHAAVFTGRRAGRFVQLFDLGLDARYVRALDPGHLHLVAVQDKRGHGRHALAGSRLLALVHVHLQEHRAFVLVGQLVVQRRHPPARAAPRGRKVHHYQVRTVLVQLLLELEVVHHLLDDHLER